ncbi:MAG TPA: isoprenylcysteine carboxylmethyltransferase family protein [Dehalococcoidia bacterium]|nr:isoprenylcysteine carboxylmethyltransferase family protein [Dehalococcoidia bacterium]
MSLIPAFEIGVWNAWIFVLYTLVIVSLLPAINKSARETGDIAIASVYNRREMIILYSYPIIVFLLLIYSVFLPLRLGTVWFYTGLPITLLGLAIYTMTMASFATTPLDREVIAKGPFRYSRHPMYLSSSLAYVGVGIACASWLFLLLTIAYAVLSLISAIPEERFLLKKYGNAYREYMNRTPRYIGTPKSGGAS